MKIKFLTVSLIYDEIVNVFDILIRVYIFMFSHTFREADNHLTYVYEATKCYSL